MVWKSSIITDYNTETLDTEMASVAKKITPNLLSQCHRPESEGWMTWLM